MRGEAWLLVLLIAPLALAANTTTLANGDSFLVDGTNFTIGTAYENHTHVRIDEHGILWEKEDCERTKYHWICLERISGNQSTFEIEEIDYNLTLTREAPDTLPVGSEFEVRLEVENHGADTAEFRVKEHTNLTIIEDERFKDLSWRGTLAPGDKKTLVYEARAQRAGTYELNATAEGGGLNATDLHDITIEDFLTVEYDYNPNITQHTNYSFSLTITSTNKDAEAEVSIVTPPKTQVAEHKNLTRKGSTLYDKDDLNHTLEYGFTYWAGAPTEEPLTLLITTTHNDTEATRTYTLPLQTHDFLPLVVIHDHHDKKLLAGASHTLPIQVHNPNPTPVAATVSMQSILHRSERKYTFAAENTTTLEYTITPNSTTSTYNLHLLITYEDPNSDPLNHTEDIHVHGAAKPPVTTLPEAPALILDAPATLANGTTATLTATITNHDGNATLHLTRDGALINETTTNSSVTYTITTPGRYTLTANLGDQTLTQEHIVRTTQQTTAQEPPSHEKSFPWLLLIIPLILTTLAIAAYVLTHDQLRLTHLEEQIALEELQLAEDTRFLSTFYPASNEDLLLQRHLEEEVEHLRRTLPQLRAEREALRTRHKYPSSGDSDEVRQ